MLKALSHPARLEIARLLRQGEACVCHLQARFGYRQAYLSQQLTVMRNAGLVSERRRGTYMYYRLSDTRVARVLDALLPSATLVRPERRDLPRGARCRCPTCATLREGCQREPC